MTDVVNDYFKQFYPSDLDRGKFEMFCGMWWYKDPSVNNVFPAMKMADGFHMSVQGHCGSYSHPRDDFADRYSAVEVGFPSEREELLMPYAANANYPTETVYGYVPVSVVEAVIAKHGGIVGTQRRWRLTQEG